MVLLKYLHFINCITIVTFKHLYIKNKDVCSFTYQIHVLLGLDKMQKEWQTSVCCVELCFYVVIIFCKILSLKLNSKSLKFRSRTGMDLMDHTAVQHRSVCQTPADLSGGFNHWISKEESYFPNSKGKLFLFYKNTHPLYRQGWEAPPHSWMFADISNLNIQMQI